jgi:hypothetical protein
MRHVDREGGAPGQRGLDHPLHDHEGLAGRGVEADVADQQPALFNHIRLGHRAPADVRLDRAHGLVEHIDAREWRAWRAKLYRAARPGG